MNYVQAVASVLMHAHMMICSPVTNTGCCSLWRSSVKRFRNRIREQPRYLNVYTVSKYSKTLTGLLGYHGQRLLQQVNNLILTMIHSGMWYLC